MRDKVVILANSSENLNLVQMDVLVCVGCLRRLLMPMELTISYSRRVVSVTLRSDFETLEGFLKRCMCYTSRCDAVVGRGSVMQRLHSMSSFRPQGIVREPNI
jgi:hypothetical protein